MQPASGMRKGALTPEDQRRGKEASPAAKLRGATTFASAKVTSTSRIVFFAKIQ